MSLLPGRGEEKSDEEKLEERMQMKESYNTGKMEQRLLAEEKEEKDKARQTLLDPEEDKARLKQLLLNVKPVEVPRLVFYCNNCGADFQEQPTKCTECKRDSSFVKKKAGTEIKWTDRTEDSLMNSRGFHKVVWSEIEPSITSSVAGGYLKSDEVSKLNYSTLATITMQLALYPWRYGVDNPSDMQQIGDIVRNPLIAHTSKARGGRGLESTEKTTVEKISHKLQSNEDEEDDVTLFN